MRHLLVVVGLSGALGGCGGSVAKNGGVPADAGGTGGVAPVVGGAAGVAPAAGGAPDDVPGTPISESLDDPSYPPVPVGGGGFIWSRGIGNWFVTTASGMHFDAGFETVDGLKVWETSAEPGVTDLWVQLNHGRGGTPIDLSAYSGIAFDVRATGAAAPLVVVFNANGDVAGAEGATASQHLTVSETWQSFEIAFVEAGVASTSVSSVDFIVSPSEPVELQVRSLALKCKAACP